MMIPSPTSQLSLYKHASVATGIARTFLPMHFLGFKVKPRRIPEFPTRIASCPCRDGW